jgi:hypothetical protein
MTPSLFGGIQPIRAGGTTIQPEVLASIQQASANTGVDFSYLMAQASRESSFDPSAKAASSSATGLYQFVEQTWLGTFKDHAGDYGYGDLADQVVKHADGHYSVGNAATRKQILDLRRDPTLNAAMAAELAADNKTKMEAALGHQVDGTDLHLAHFLGLSGALRFIRQMGSDPTTTGAAMFPKAAAANPTIFYDDSGNARTIGEIYAKMDKSMSTDQQTFAALSNGVTGGKLGAGAKGTAVASAVSATTNADGGLQGFSKPGSILSPLLLVTIAALPTARDEDPEKQQGSGGLRHGAIKPTVGSSLNAMSALGLG